MANRIMGIDPGTTTSPTAISMIEIENDIPRIKGIYAIKPLISALSFTNRIRLISATIKILIDGFKPDSIFLEFSHYMGKANILFLKLLGAIETQVFQDIEYVYPTQVKKMLGSGKLEKFEVAENLKGVYKKDVKIIQSLIDVSEFDTTDCLAISWAGYLLKKQSMEIKNGI